MSRPFGEPDLPLVQFFAFHFPPSTASGAARPGRLARYLPEHGFRCRIAAFAVPGASSSGSTHFLSPEDARGGWRAVLPLTRALQGIVPYNEQLPWLPAALGHALQAHRAEPAQAVISSFPPLAAHLAGLFFHLRTGVPWIADFRDPLAGSPFRARRWARLYDEALEAAFLRAASAVLVTNDAIANRLRARYPRWESKFHVLWNGFDPQQPAPAPAPATAPRRIVHAGSLYGPRRPDSLLRAMAVLLEQGTVSSQDWRIQFVGPHEPDTFARCAADVTRLQAAGLLEIRPGQRPREELEEAMSAASILVLLDLTGGAGSVQVPAKLFDYVRSGLPVAAWSPVGSPTRHVLERAGVPVLLFAPGEPDQQVAARLLPWLESPPPPSRPSEWFLETFDGARQVAMVARLLREMLAGRP